MNARLPDAIQYKFLLKRENIKKYSAENINIRLNRRQCADSVFGLMSIQYASPFFFLRAINLSRFERCSCENLKSNLKLTRSSLSGKKNCYFNKKLMQKVSQDGLLSCDAVARRVLSDIYEWQLKGDNMNDRSI